jgi:hypothetical protein
MNGTTGNNELRVPRIDNNAATDNGERIRNILIFDNHPDSLRLVRELYRARFRSSLLEYLIASVLIILALVATIFCIA